MMLDLGGINPVHRPVPQHSTAGPCHPRLPTLPRDSIGPTTGLPRPLQLEGRSSKVSDCLMFP
jgi:hypothetical protein